jgi:hypothetical protein
VLRRREGASWVRARELPSGRRVDPSAHLVRLFAAQDLLAETPDDALLDERLALVEGAVIETRSRRGADGWEQSAELRLETGIPFSAELDRFTAEVIAQLDGARPARETLFSLAREHDADPDAVLRASPGLLRGLLDLGFVERAAAF